MESERKNNMEKVRLTVEVDPDVKYQFKLACMVKRTDMKKEVEDFMKRFTKSLNK